MSLPFYCKIFVFAFALMFLLATIMQQPLRASTTVTDVVDGDTIKTPTETIRLACIDAPEAKQEGGDAATAKLRQLVSQKSIQLERLDRDRYNRTIAIVRKNETNINQEMLRTGNAVVYFKYLDTCPKERQYIDAERQAQYARKGIWNEYPCMPWEYRHDGCPVETTSKIYPRSSRIVTHP